MGKGLVAAWDSVEFGWTHAAGAWATTPGNAEFTAPFVVPAKVGTQTRAALRMFSSPSLVRQPIAAQAAAMAKYLISFPADAMVVSDEDFPTVVADSHAVIERAKAAGVYVFGGGIDASVEPVLVGDDGSTTPFTGRHLDGGFTVLELPSRAEAIEWASRIAAACRCPQELREFGYDPAS